HRSFPPPPGRKCDVCRAAMPKAQRSPCQISRWPHHRVNRRTARAPVKNGVYRLQPARLARPRLPRIDTNPRARTIDYVEAGHRDVERVLEIEASPLARPDERIELRQEL